ncbi:VIT and vWA domain-containing protein [Pelagicoccus mobilis]|uniref:VWA domain-containing protein n=1 Tax=Pelagicoccus mobilis TaxID=415221 RepID=A0A934RZH4_9BACT|nr:VIT and VWA domain-containing protein [Pelagicoccus mobilis]MBK1878174.1 VWA domain-containing protein [Pelagicoccus mobilis]
MKNKTNSLGRSLLLGFGLLASAAASQAAGLLTPVSSSDQLLDLRSHHVRVVINNGFARTEVEQVFSNPNAYELEAIYSAPVPEAGALSELTIHAGERVLNGEVVAKSEADRIYQEEKSQGNEVGKADKNSYQNYEFSVYPVPAQGEVRMSYVYYEPLKIDTGVGRYTYPLEEGGTDDGATSFWTMNDVVSSDFSVEVVLKSAYPVTRTRVPEYGGVAQKQEDGTLLYRYESQGELLDQDFVFYYMLEENLPGRLEMLTYRESEDKPGSFMMVMTPGVDLKPLEGGADYVFALDVSGSMKGKLHTLTTGVKKAIGQLKPEDRFRIVAFSDSAYDLNREWVNVTEANVRESLHRLDQLASGGGTNVYAGVSLAMDRLDSDRVATLILVTDGVTNRGIVDPKEFYKVMHRQDFRFYGFLLGNSSNWPLMQLMCDASGGSYRAVSNSDDIIGEVLIAKNKIAYESLRQAELSIKGVNTYDVGDFKIGKIHFGDQLVLFGRYEEGGPAKVTLKARVNGQDQTYSTEIDFPEIDRAHPELERMWALDQVRKIEVNKMAGFVEESEAKVAIRDIGVAYQIVTDETSMIALDDDGFSRHGVERRNLERVAREQQARQHSPASNGAQRVDASAPMYQRKAPSLGGGGAGAIEHWFLGLILAGGAVLAIRGRKKGSQSKAFLLVGALTAGAVTGDRLEASGVDGFRWTDRDTRLPAGESSIDQSIANFWEVSEEEAREDAPARRLSATPRYVPPPVSHPGCSPSRVVYEIEDGRDTHRVDQRRDRKNSRGHFGLNLFNAISVFDFVWGEESRSESDSYSGKVKR